MFVFMGDRCKTKQVPGRGARAGGQEVKQSKREINYDTSVNWRKSSGNRASIKDRITRSKQAIPWALSEI